jgi:hypothetical protein
MRSVVNFILIFALGFVLSCAQKAAGPLQVSFKPDTSFILPGIHKAFSSCYDSDIAGPRFLYPRMDISWNGVGDFFPAILKVKFKSGQVGGEYECTLSENITSLFQTKETTPVAVTDNFFESGKTYELKSSCALECGGISVPNEDASFKIPGEVKLIGYSVDDEGIQRPYTARGTIYLQNLN